MIKKSTKKDLTRLNTFGMKVRAAHYISYDSAEDLAALDWGGMQEPVLAMGGGSNILFCRDFPGTVLHSDIKFIDLLEDNTSDEVLVRAGSGMVWDDLCDWAARKGFWGPENLSAIPGTVGAAPVQNIGAYGVEAADLIARVECFDRCTRNFTVFEADECHFGYRWSRFKEEPDRYIVVAVVLRFTRDFRPRLDYGNLREEVERNIEISQPISDPYQIAFKPIVGVPDMPLTPMLVRDTVKVIRENKLPSPSKTGSAGSFFKNPVVDAEVFGKVVETAARIAGGNEEMKVPHYELPDGKVKIPAAWLIDFCGMKGASMGGASVWEKQPLVIVNTRGKATPEDVLALENAIIARVRDVFTITLEPEVVHI